MCSLPPRTYSVHSCYTLFPFLIAHFITHPYCEVIIDTHQKKKKKPAVSHPQPSPCLRHCFLISRQSGKTDKVENPQVSFSLCSAERFDVRDNRPDERFCIYFPDFQLYPPKRKNRKKKDYSFITSFNINTFCSPKVIIILRAVHASVEICLNFMGGGLRN